MKGTFTATAAVTIKATVERVWKALVDPDLIKHYLFGTDAISDWKIGSSITYRGEWQGKPYEDKGKILDLVPNKLFRSTYWSSLAGLPDAPEHYNTVTYELSEAGGETTLTVTQDNVPTKEAADHSTRNWMAVLQSLAGLVEG